MENEDEQNYYNQRKKCIRKYDVKPSTEEGFDLQTCFQEPERKVYNPNKIMLTEEGKAQQKQEQEGMEQDGGQEVGYVKTDDYYFDSYGHFNIHEEMLKDKVRTNAYKNAILQNKHLFEGKVVLDIGCGTGILSIFAAQAGAKLVIGVDNANIADIATKIIKVNGYESKIKILKGKIEDVNLPVDQVDIIISEWMGYFLLYESMLDCVLWARDRYLKKDGLMFPDRAVMFMATIEDEEYFEEKINFWDSVYGVDMSCIKKWSLKEPLVELIDAKNINGEACAILDIDLQKVKVEDLDFTAKYSINVIRQDYVHGFIVWFETYFSYSHLQVRLSTSPFSKATHWKQTLFYINNPIPVHQGDKVTGSIAVKKCEENERNIDVKLSLHLKNKVDKYDQVYAYKIN